MRRRIKTGLMIERILQSSEHRKMQTLSMIFHKMPYLSKQKSNEMDKLYINLYEYNNFCDYLTHPKFRIAPTYFANANTPNQPPKPPGPAHSSKNKPERSPTEKKLLSTIKQLNDYKETFSVYTQAEDTINSMTAKQGKQHKKYLVYIYKWILNQRWKNRELQKLGDELKKTVMGKIYEGHQVEEEQKEIKTELEKVELEAKSAEEIQKKRQQEEAQKIISSYKGKEDPQPARDKNKQ